MKRSITLQWSDDSDHEWNDFGVIENEAHSLDDDLHAKNIYIWRRQSLDDIIENVIDAAYASVDMYGDSDIINTFAFVVSLSNLIPIHIKRVESDDLANSFISLIKTIDKKQVIYQDDLKQYHEIRPLIEYFIKKDVLELVEDKYLIKGSVLNNVSIL